jgi:dephospho-CoA kinase
MLNVGLTGGIGSGKTIASKIFEILGIPVYQADAAAKSLMESNPILKNQLIEHFSENAFVDGKLNRKYIADIIFNDKEKLHLINSLVHPYTIQDGIEWMKKQTTPYAIKEAALIFESGTQSNFDYIIGISSPQSMRLNRTIKRDNTNRELILEKMEHQLDEQVKMKLCDFVLQNDEKTLLTTQVIAVHEKLIALSKAQQPHD